MRYLAAALLLGLAACNQPAEAPAPEAPAAPQSLLDQVTRMAAENQPVFAWQQLTAYQQAHPDVQPACTSIRRAESMGIVPEDVRPDSPYAPHVGSLIFSVQCGPQLTSVGDDPREHWLVVFVPGADAVQVINCANAQGRDACGRIFPRAAASP